MTTLTDVFQIIEGSVCGREHRRIGLNNQDARLTSIGPLTLLGVVCDGCGSASCAEVGATMGVRFIHAAISEACQMSRGLPDPTDEDASARWWDRVTWDVAGRIKWAAKLMSKSDTDIMPIIRNHFLFTVVGFVITEKNTWLFSFGDGLIVVNGEPTILRTPLKNTPMYIAYLLTGTTAADANSHWMKMSTCHYPTDQIQSMLIGTDGMTDFMERSGDDLPSGRGIVPNIWDLWIRDEYYATPQLFGRLLTIANTEKSVAQICDDGRVQTSKRKALFPDDTTAIIVRRIPPPEENECQGDAT